MKMCSLFDGSGGFPLAGALCGIKPVMASEIEPYPIAVTRSRFPNMYHVGDVSKVNGAEMEPVDIITFGSPCQDLSVAGKRAGLKHKQHGDEETTRSGLFMESIRIIKQMREATNGIYPTFALWENVPGAFSSNKGEDFRVVLEELIKIKEPSATMPPADKNGWPYADVYVGNGWSIAYRTFDAQFWGVPQRRRRIYLVADFRGERAGKILFEREGLRRDTETSRKTRKRTPGDAEDGTGAANTETDGSSITPETPQNDDHDQYLFQPVTDGHILDDQGGQQITVRTDGKSPTLRAETHGNLPCVMQETAVYSIENHPADSRVDIDTSGKVQTLTSRMGTGGGNVPLVMEEKQQVINLNKGDVQSKTILDPNGIAPSIYAGECRGGGGELYVLDKKDPIICLEGNGARPSHKGNGYIESDKMYTLNTIERHAVAYQEPVICLQGNGIDRADTARCNGKGWKEDVSYTLNTIDRPAVAYPVTCLETFHCTTEEDRTQPLKARDYKDPLVVTMAAPDQKDPVAVGVMASSAANAEITDGKISPCLMARAGTGENQLPLVGMKTTETQYIVRRLTPTECCRLQGFPDGWGEINPKEDFTDEEYRFWYEVRNTHAAINGKKQQSYTKEQMLTWYNKLHTDSAEYKMWGNGIALPTALYVMEGISEALREQEDDDHEENDSKGTSIPADTWTGGQVFDTSSKCIGRINHDGVFQQNK